MEIISILGALVVALIGYIAVALQEKSFLNILTPLYVVFVPSNILVDLFGAVEFGPTASTYAYFLNYSSYAAFLGMTAIGYLLAVPTFRLPIASTRRLRGSRLTAYLLLVTAIALWWPVLSQFRADILSPRAIYEETRSGFGINFFLSTTACYLALIMFLFQKSSKLEFSSYLLACMFFMWTHGSKGHMLGILLILAMYYVYVAQKRVGIVGFAWVTGFFVGAGLFLFLLTNPGLLLQDGAVLNLVGYSSYTANSMKVIDSNIGPFDGRLTLEQQLYTRTPRLFVPGKPHDFGEFSLAKRFFPAAYESDTGAPAFGFGVLLADFGPVTPFILALFGLINGLIMKSFANSLHRYNGPGEFILLLFAAGVPIIPIANTFLLPETIVFAIIANLLHRIRPLDFRGRTNSPAARPVNARRSC